MISLCRYTMVPLMLVLGVKVKFKKIDYIIIAIICFFLGIFLVSQYYTSKEYKKIIQPENNSVIALEVAKLTKSNARLRQEVEKLTLALNTYKNISESDRKILEKYKQDAELYDMINGDKSTKGQGVVIKVEGKMTTAQVVDLVNAIKNIGSSIISINDRRLVLNTSYFQHANEDSYEIKILGNSKLLKDSITRKGGIIEQISAKDLKISVDEMADLEIPSGISNDFIYANIVQK